MLHVCHMYGACMSHVCHVHAAYMPHVCCMYAAYMPHVCSMYAACMPHVCCMYAACMAQYLSHMSTVFSATTAPCCTVWTSRRQHGRLDESCTDVDAHDRQRLLFMECAGSGSLVSGRHLTSLMQPAVAHKLENCPLLPLPGQSLGPAPYCRYVAGALDLPLTAPTWPEPLTCPLLPLPDRSL